MEEITSSEMFYQKYALVTGPLTLKRRFLEENFGPANLRFQMLQFFDISIRKFRSVTPFSQKTTTTRDKSFSYTGVG